MRMLRHVLVVFPCLFLALAGPARLATAVEFQAALASIRAAEVQAMIEVLASDEFEGREAGSQGGQAASEYLVRHLSGHHLRHAGDEGGFTQTFQGSCHNVLGALEGRDPDLRRQYVLLCAHYDHVGYGTRRNSRGPIGYIHHGADDNASGVAGLLEALKAFDLLDDRPKRSVLFAFWDGEEQGLLGSKHWLANPTIPLRQVAFVINVDMIGRMQEQRLKVFGTRSGSGLRRLVSLQNAASDLLLDFSWEVKQDSDHHPFFSQGIPTLMLHTGLHDDFHRPSDLAEKINRGGAEQATKLLFLVAHDLANQPQLPPFRQQARFETPADATRLEQPLPPAAPRLGVIWERRKTEPAGLYVTQVHADSAGDRAGVRVGDRLLRVGRRAVDDEAVLRIQILAAKSPLEIVVERASDDKREEHKLSAELAGEPMRVGISWREDEAEAGTVIISRVTFGSPAALAGLRPGDRIYQVAGRDFPTGKEFMEQLTAATGTLALQIEREGRVHTVQIALPSVE